MSKEFSTAEYEDLSCDNPEVFLSSVNNLKQSSIHESKAIYQFLRETTAVIP